MTQTQTIELVPATDQEARLADEVGQTLARFASGDAPLQLTLTRANGERLEASVPVVALQALAQILGQMRQGKPVTLLPHRAELTTHQAAALLHVSRPFLIKLLDQGAIPHRKVGRNRRVRYEDLRAYLDREKEDRRKTLVELAAYDQELGLDDLAAR
jgi:excisionase family DNA binding protein